MIANAHFGPRSIGEDDLQAYVDGQLDARRRSEVEAYLVARPEEVERVEAYRLQNIALHALFDQPVAEPASAPIDRLRRDLHGAVGRQRLFRRTAASLVLVLGIGALGWWSFGLEAPSRESGFLIARQASERSHPEPRDPPRAQSAAEVTQASLVGWLSQRASGERQDWPDLRPLGLTLRGERLAAAAGSLAVVLRYEDAIGRRLTLHLNLNGDDLPIVAPSPVGEEEVALYWRAGPLVLGVIGAMEHGEVLRIAEAVTDQITAVAPDWTPRTDGQVVSAQSEPAADSEAAPESVTEQNEGVKPPENSVPAEPFPTEGDQGAHSASDTKSMSTLAPTRPQRASHLQARVPSPASGDGRLA